MLTAYIKAALRKAHYKILPDGEGYFGTIEGLQGVWANAETLEACRENCERPWRSGLSSASRWDICYQRLMA